MLAALALTVFLLGLGVQAPTPVPTPPAPPHSQLPTTQPGLSGDEGVFLVTAGDDGGKLVYFIAQNQRHNTLTADLLLEQQLNPLWPVRLASRDEVLAFGEAAPVGSALTGLLGSELAVEPEPEPTPTDTALLADALPAPADRLPPPSEAATEHTLTAGETLMRLSAQSGTSVQAIQDANGISNANLVYIGQIIHIPAQPAATSPGVLPETASDAAADASVAVPPETASDVLAEAEPVTYTVKGGDSAMSISRRFGVDVETLLATNAVANRNHIEAGQILTIPG
jgi:LysM repeat protein